MITLILEPKEYSPHAIQRYRALGPVYAWPDIKGAKKKKIEAAADVIVARLGHQLDKAFLSRFPKLKVIATPTTGLNHINFDEALRRGIKIISLRGYTNFLSKIPSTAEETMGLIFDVMRRLPWAFEDVKKGGWHRDLWKGHQLFGKTLGLIGCGRLGKRVAKYARAFGMRVVGFDPYVSKKELTRAKIEKAELAYLLKHSDIVSLHVLLTDATHNLFQKKHFKMMKRTGYFINTARAELIERNALITALTQKWIAGAAVDVMWDERGDGTHLKKDPLWAYAKRHTNFIIVPHIGGATYEAMQVTEDFIADQVVRYVHKAR